ncbi:MAG: ABC transporter ATP-binding protein [Acidobacteriaceae bacterium]
MTAVAPAIETRQLHRAFGNVEALAPLDLVIPRGAIFALVGHNGAGKTTLIKLLLNMIRPTSGSAITLGQSATTLTGNSFQHIGYVSENQEMPEWMTVQELMNYLHPFYPTWDETNLLANLELPPDRKIKHLSRGMRMKLALATVLAFRPSLIVMDEPFSGLDPLVRDQLIESLLDSLHSDQGPANDSGATILISSHDLAEVESFATHVAFMHEGKLLFAEPMETLTARFREVTVTLTPDETPSQVSPNVPASWLLPESTNAFFRFIYTEGDAKSLEGEVRKALPNAANIQSEPMTLRTIFLALVKSSRMQNRRHS